ncbi:MAG: MFS transporter [Pseudomonadales bacterium]
MSSSNSTGGAPTPLGWGVKLAFGIGAIGEAAYMGMFNTFITIYYNQAIGLSNTLIGLAVMLALIADAVTDPMVGLLSDRHRSPMGRRHPFLWAAPVPLALALYAIFNPPQALIGETYALFAWLAFWTILSRGFVTLFNVPHLALGGELSKQQHERSQLFSANTVFTYLSGAGFAFFAWSFFQGDRVRASDGATVPGQLDPAAYLPLVIFVCAVILIAIWTCAAGTAKAAKGLSQRSGDEPKLTLQYFFSTLLRTLKNRNYLILLCGYFFFMITSGIYDTMNVFINTYFWELEPQQIRWFGLVAAPTGVIGALLAPTLMRRFDRKPVMLVALFGTVVFAQLVVNLRLLGVLPDNGDPLLLPCLLANAAGFFFSIGVGGVTIYSMIGDVIDENELVTGLREEGLFYSARAFFAKASYSFGHFFAGVMLDYFVRLPFEAVPGALDADVLMRLGLTAGPIMGVAALLAIFVYYQYQLDRTRHAEILAGIASRQATKAAAEPELG